MEIGVGSWIHEAAVLQRSDMDQVSFSARLSINLCYPNSATSEMDPSKFSNSIIPTCSKILDLPPSCIEFVPGFPKYFIVGTYNLQKDIDTGSLPQSRTGSLSLFRIVGADL